MSLFNVAYDHDPTKQHLPGEIHDADRAAVIDHTGGTINSATELTVPTAKKILDDIVNEEMSKTP